MPLLLAEASRLGAASWGALAVEYSRVTRARPHAADIAARLLVSALVGTLARRGAQYVPSPAPTFLATPSAIPSTVVWPSTLVLPDANATSSGTDYLYFTVPDRFTVTAVGAYLINFRHFRANVRRAGAASWAHARVARLTRPCRCVPPPSTNRTW